MDTFELRPYTPADAEALFALDKICFGPQFRFTLRDIRNFAERPNAIALIATCNDAIVGFIIAHLEGTRPPRRCYIDTIDVAPESRGKGIAHRMLQQTEQQARAAAADLITLHVHVGNTEAIRFYQRQAYRQSGAAPAFYGSPGLDAAVYSKML